MGPPTPSTSKVAPTSSGATSWTLRAKNSLPSARVVADEGGDGKGDDDSTRHAREPTGDDREAQARQRGDHSRLDVPEGRGGRHLGELDPGDAPAEVVRRHRPEDRAAQDGAHVVGRTGGGEQEQSCPETPGEAEACDRDAPERGGDRYDEPLAADVADPSGGERRGERARIGRGVHQAEDPRAPVEALERERREEGARHP